MLSPKEFIEDAVQKVKDQIGDEKAIIALSGGVDSSVCSVLVQQAIGDKRKYIEPQVYEDMYMDYVDELYDEFFDDLKIKDYIPLAGDTTVIKVPNVSKTKEEFPVEEGKSGIKIKPENRGKFTATKKRTGKTTEELTHSKNPLTRKRAIFAQNAAKWKH